MRDLRHLAFLAVAFVPCFVGGGLGWPELGIIAMAAGLYLAVFPPCSRISPRATLALVLLLAVPAFSFLPLGQLLGGAWRMAFTRECGVNLGPLVSPQPWVSAEASALYLLGWFLLLTRAADPPVKEELFVLVSRFALAVGLIAAIALEHRFGKPFLPYWSIGIHTVFGCFLNRNQFGDLLALGGILALVAGLQRRQRSPVRVAAHFISLVLVFAALIVNTSRGGIALFFGAGFVWLLWVSIRSRSLQKGGRIAAIVMALLALLLVFGGAVVQRFLEIRGAGGGLTPGFRWLLAKDVVAMAKAMPVFGVGIGNFADVFGMFRHFSLSPGRALHPDSDLFWLLGEGGVAGLACTLLAIFLLIRPAFVFERDSVHNLRAAALVATGAFLIHSLFDVSGHRIGTLLPALYVLWIAFPAPAVPKPMPLPASLLFRLFGIAFLVLGALWWRLAPSVPWPSTARAAALGAEAEAAMKRRDFPAAAAADTAALEITPLDWRLYYQRGLSRFYRAEYRDQAEADFHRARFLTPQRLDLRLEEAALWRPVRPLLSLQIYQEALAEVSGTERVELYRSILDQSFGNPFVRRPLLAMAGNDIAMRLAYLDFATPAEIGTLLEGFLSIDREMRYLSPSQLRLVLNRWAELGGIPDLVARMEEIPSWQAVGWPIMAHYYAGLGQYRRAYEMARSRDPLPPLPALLNIGSKEEVATQARLHPNQAVFQIQLFLLQRASDLKEEREIAAATLRKLTAIPECPAYLFYYQAEERASAGDWPQAWALYNRYRR